MADRMNVFEAQKWAFSFADDHGMERSTIDMLICGQMDWDVTHLLMHYPSEVVWTPIWLVYHRIWKNIKKKNINKT